METTACGWFYDGETGERRAVVLHFAGVALSIKSDAWPSPQVWPYAQIRTADFLADGGVRLQLDNGEARLVLDAAGLERLAKHVPSLSRGRQQRQLWTRGAAAGLATAGLAGLFYFGWPVVSDGLARLIPGSLLAAIGESAVESLTHGSAVCSGPAAATIIGKLTAQISASLPDPRPFHVRVIDTPQVNAFATPGGNIVVFRGLIDKADSPDELAGVLAHEIGHLAKHHPQRLLIRYSGLSLLGIALFGDSNFASLGSVLITLSYSRDFETEADTEAITLLAAAKLDTGGLARFFTRLEKEGKQDTPAAFRYLSSHPPTSERRQRIEHAAHAGAAALSEREWREVRNICR